VDDIFSYDDKTASRFTVSMTDVASGKPVDVKLLAIDRFVGGQIAEEWQQCPRQMVTFPRQHITTSISMMTKGIAQTPKARLN
jgi:hypothetical protein